MASTNAYLFNILPPLLLPLLLSWTLSNFKFKFKEGIRGVVLVVVVVGVNMGYTGDEDVKVETGTLVDIKGEAMLVIFDENIGEDCLTNLGETVDANLADIAITGCTGGMTIVLLYCKA